MNVVVAPKIDYHTNQNEFMKCLNRFLDTINLARCLRQMPGTVVLYKPSIFEKSLKFCVHSPDPAERRSFNAKVYLVDGRVCEANGNLPLTNISAPDVFDHITLYGVAWATMHTPISISRIVQLDRQEKMFIFLIGKKICEDYDGGGDGKCMIGLLVDDIIYDIFDELTETICVHAVGKSFTCKDCKMETSVIEARQKRVERERSRTNPRQRRLKNTYQKYIRKRRYQK